MNQKQLLDNLKKDSSLDDIQEYIKKVIDIRGFGKEIVEQKLLLLLEEVGELAKSIRKEKTNMCIDKNKVKNYSPVEEEIADVFIVLTAICNTLNINLYDCIIEKERINVERTWGNSNKND